MICKQQDEKRQNYSSSKVGRRKRRKNWTQSFKAIWWWHFFAYFLQAMHLQHPEYCFPNFVGHEPWEGATLKVLKSHKWFKSICAWSRFFCPISNDHIEEIYGLFSFITFILSGLLASFSCSRFPLCSSTEIMFEDAVKLTHLWKLLFLKGPQFSPFRTYLWPGRICFPSLQSGRHSSRS